MALLSKLSLVPGSCPQIWNNFQVRIKCLPTVSLVRGKKYVFQVGMNKVNARFFSWMVVDEPYVIHIHSFFNADVAAFITVSDRLRGRRSVQQNFLSASRMSGEQGGSQK